MKTYVLTVSMTFPKTHKRAGERTWFSEKIKDTVMLISKYPILGGKKHTIRANYELWERRAKQINEGKAILSLRYWSGIPYRSKQVEFLQLTKIGLQKLNNPTNFIYAEIDGKKYDWGEVANNDGLSFEDFCEWFKIRQNSPMAVIHFTDWRY